MSGVVAKLEELDDWVKENPKNKPTYIMKSFGEDIELTKEEKEKL